MTHNEQATLLPAQLYCNPYSTHSIEVKSFLALILLLR